MVFLNMTAFLKLQKTWSEKTFGTGKRTVGLCNHIRSELIEIEQLECLEEWVDVLLLAFDATWRLEASPEQVVKELLRKQQENIDREWGPIPPETEPSFHLEST